MHMHMPSDGQLTFLACADRRLPSGLLVCFLAEQIPLYADGLTVLIRLTRRLSCPPTSFLALQYAD